MTETRAANLRHCIMRPISLGRVDRHRVVDPFVKAFLPSERSIKSIPRHTQRNPSIRLVFSVTDTDIARECRNRNRAELGESIRDCGCGEASRDANVDTRILEGKTHEKVDIDCGVKMCMKEASFWHLIRMDRQDSSEDVDTRAGTHFLYDAIQFGLFNDSFSCLPIPWTVRPTPQPLDTSCYSPCPETMRNKFSTDLILK